VILWVLSGLATERGTLTWGLCPGGYVRSPHNIAEDSQQQ